jgi:hypothetical protein
MQRITRRRIPALLIASVSVKLPAAEHRAFRTISTPRDGYCGWPTLARRASGDLVLVWSGDREAHVCPFGRVKFAMSRDEGESWTWPRVLMDSDLDDRDAGIVETPRRSLVVSTFTSLAYQAQLERARHGDAKWPPDKLARWEAIQKRLDPATRKSRLGSWMLRTTDEGMSWSTPYRVPVNSPHGPVAISNSRLLYAGKDLYENDGRIGVCESIDDGVSWQWLATIPTRPGDTAGNYHELHAVETSPGRLIAQIRNHNQVNRNETLQTESEDGGKSWSTPHSIGVWGLPSHLLRLRDGRVLMTYGYRRQPFGNQARITEDEGRTWSEGVIVSSDGASGDLGYPSTVELSDGALLTVWYELRPGADQAVLRQVRWRV